MTGVLLRDPDAHRDTSPIMFIDGRGQISITDIGAITAQIYDTSNLNLEEAARAASTRDEQSAVDLLTDFVGIDGAVLSIQ